MKLLLDTHTFIWWDSQPSQLSSQVLAHLQDRNNRIFLSAVSIWEIQIKHSLGRLQLSKSLAEIIASQHLVNDIEELPITFRHILTVEQLPFHHKDPFDRLLIAQAIYENAILVSKDSVFVNYSVSVLW